MEKLGARPGSIEAWIAPCVRTSNYEVSAEMVRDFAREFPRCPVSPDGRHLDLTAIAIDQLRAAGLSAKKISDSGACTFTDAESFHSYRRDGALAGRLLTMIGMTEQNTSPRTK
jgi:copper oxidase (laccase) domain-containing protein